MREPDSPRFSSSEVCPDKGKFFDLGQMFEILDSQFPVLNPQPGQANQCHWELRKSGCAFRRSGSTALPLRTTRARMSPRANVDRHKAARRFSVSTSHFAMPMIPASLPDGRYRAGLFADAIVARQRSNISTNRAWTEYQDPHRAKLARVGLNSPMREIAAGTSQQKEAATPANRQHSVRRGYQKCGHSRSRTPPIFIWLRWRRRPDIGNTVHQICERAIPTTILLRCDTAAKPFAADSTPIARLAPSLRRNAPARNLPQSCS